MGGEKTFSEQPMVQISPLSTCFRNSFRSLLSYLPLTCRHNTKPGGTKFPEHNLLVPTLRCRSPPRCGKEWEIEGLKKSKRTVVCQVKPPQLLIPLYVEPLMMLFLARARSNYVRTSLNCHAVRWLPLLCSIYFAYPSAEGPVGLVMQKLYPSEFVLYTGN